MVATKKFDPLWEIVDEKVALQNAEPDIDAPCPYCNVPLHLGAVAPKGAKVTCGLCGGTSQVVDTVEGVRLKAE
jgi:hypothetical protein